jgi:hypothetical protein
MVAGTQKGLAAVQEEDLREGSQVLAAQGHAGKGPGPNISVSFSSFPSVSFQEYLLARTERHQRVKEPN